MLMLGLGELAQLQFKSIEDHESLPPGLRADDSLDTGRLRRGNIDQARASLSWPLTSS
jgi:hypothetical protein